MALKPKQLTRDTCTPQQLRCWDALSYVVGGDHRLPRNVYECGEGIKASFTGEAATYDDSLLTRLVLVAHADAVRFAISGSGPYLFAITAHPRSHEHICFMGRHPTLRDLADDALAFPPHSGDKETN